MVVIVCIWLLRIMSALTAPISMALLAPVEEPSTASQAVASSFAKTENVFSRTLSG
jgi:hypothetical protein